VVAAATGLQPHTITNHFLCLTRWTAEGDPRSTLSWNWCDTNPRRCWWTTCAVGGELISEPKNVLNVCPASLFYRTLVHIFSRGNDLVRSILWSPFNVKLIYRTKREMLMSQEQRSANKSSQWSWNLILLNDLIALSVQIYMASAKKKKTRWNREFGLILGLSLVQVDEINHVAQSRQIKLSSASCLFSESVGEWRWFCPIIIDN
jgi:hypothetical protein